MGDLRTIYTHNVTYVQYDMTDSPDADDYTPYEQRPETYIVPVLFFIIFVVGVLGNGTLVVIFLRHRAMRNVPNTYIFSLALADLLVIITCVPFTSIIYTVESWPWGVAVCKISETTKNISVGVSVFTLTALSAERYCAIVNPLRRLQTKPLTVISAGMIWLLAAGFALPDAICSQVVKVGIASNKTISVCIPFPNITNKVYAKYNMIAKSMVYYFIPLSIIAFFYVLMALRLHASVNEMPGEMKGSQATSQVKARRHVARMVLIFVFLFFICFLPQHVHALWFHLYPYAEEEYNDWWHALKIIGYCLSFLNSCVNPIALYCVSGVFRAHFNRYLCCRTSVWSRGGPAGAACEMSFNSTYRRNTQRTSLEKSSSFRPRRSTHEVNLINLDGNHKGGMSDVTMIRDTSIALRRDHSRSISCH